jgi:pseudaminic acid biosynthesis-associated methylase
MVVDSTAMTNQLQEWQGTFGREYTDRNIVDPASRVDGFRDLLKGLEVNSILEVGCNRGHNLIALDMLGCTAVGVEPGEYARTLARANGLAVAAGDTYDIPFPDRSTDLVFTSGVLIHVPRERLLEALAELVRVTDRYLLAIEYHSDSDEEIPYQGRDGMLWRRDYARLFEALHGFTIVRAGLAPAGFDGASFVIAERSG